MLRHPRTLGLAAIAASFTLLTSAAFASPSGLNNIPTADTTPQGTFVLQTYSTVGGYADSDFNLGFKTGLDFKVVRIELGLDSHIYPAQAGPLTAQGKLAVPLGEHLPTIAVGAANVAFTSPESKRAGDVFGYAVVTQDFGWFRVHGGCAYVDTNALPFAGLDKTFHYTKSVAGSGKSGKSTMESKTIDLFTLRGDVIQQRDSSWLYSVGVLVPVCKYFVFETWTNLPDNGDSPSWTIKGNFIVSF